MTNRLHNLADASRTLEEFVIELANAPEGWWAIVLAAVFAAIGVVVVWMYRHEGRIGASPRARMLLAIVRCVVLGTLAFILLEPVRVRILRRWIDSYTLILVDDSASMDLADAYREEDAANRVAAVIGEPLSQPVPRREVVARLLTANDRGLLRGFAKYNRLKLFSFHDEPSLRGTVLREGSRVATAGDSAADPNAPKEGDVYTVPVSFSPTGSTTNIERAVRRAVESVGSAPISGIVVLSDGGFNAGATVEETARIARERRIPIHAIGIGDPSEPRNIRVAELTAPEAAFQKDPVAINARLTAEGLEGESLRVELLERVGDGGDEGRVIDSRTIQVALGGSVAPLTFERRPAATGRHVYTLRVSPVPGESITDDNERQVSVNIIDARTRVLLVSGLASWEYRFVATLLERDATFDLSCWLQSADTAAVRDGTTVIDRLPSTPEELFAYDAILLLDPDPKELDEDWCRMVDTWVVEHGGGLLFAAARPYTPAFMREPALKLLRDLLPVTFDPEADLVLNQVGHYQQTPSPIEIPPGALGHPIAGGQDGTATWVIWHGGAEVYWHYPVLREKPAATVLMRHGDPRLRNSYGGRVLLATQYVGAGRSAFLGFDGTWRWRKYGQDEFNRFWVQLTRFLAEGRRLGGSRRGMLLVENDEYSPGEVVNVSARLLDARYEPLRSDQVTVRYALGEDRGELNLTPQRDRPGWFEGRFVPDRTGICRLSITLPVAPSVSGDRRSESNEITREFRVSRPNLEVRRPNMNRDALMTLAEQSYGGRYYEVDEAMQLSDAIPDSHEEVAIRSRPQSLWDRGFTLWMLVGLLSLEWGVRKWKHLL